MASIPHTAGQITPANLEDFRRQIDELWRRRILAYAAQLESAWARFDTMTIGINEYAGDVPAEEFGPVFNCFDQLRRLGVRFDPRFILRMNRFRTSAVALDVDGEEDRSDELIDYEDDDFEYSMTELPHAWSGNAAQARAMAFAMLGYTRGANK